MPQPSVSKANDLLGKALTQAPKFKPTVLSGQMQDDIKSIIHGSHLTFRYILVTALLAKVTEPSIHMRSLQSGADLTGAYDARSLCHKVFVPFEHSHLDCKLGGSNEPYLNKPARFPAVNENNAVRAGNDQRLLTKMHHLLEALNNSKATIQYEAFLFAMQCIMSRTGATVEALNLSPVLFSSQKTSHLLSQFLSSSFGGETVVVVAAAILKVRYGDGYEIDLHPANEAGSSSNEIGDIDVKANGKVILPVEAKDKVFSETDVEHAISKARKIGKLLFVRGRNGKLESGTEESLIEKHAAAGFDLSFIPVDNFVKTETAMFNNSQRRAMVSAINSLLVTMRAKDETKDFWGTCLEECKMLVD